MTRPRLRWTALLFVVPILVLTLVGLEPEQPRLAPPGADGEPRALGLQVIDDRPATDADRYTDVEPDPDDEPRAAPLLRPERQTGAGAVASGPASTDEQSIDPGPEPGFVPSMVTDEGFEVVGGAARAGVGERVNYTVEVEPIVDVDPLAFAAAVERALHDPRSWAADVELVRVDDPADARIRVLLASPAEVDRLCAEAGLNTAGRFSCWNGRFAALNAMRWTLGAADFDAIDTYRTYLVNHEFGHGLGFGHVDCPGTKRAAPIMMQQTMSTGSCAANGWPYPERSAD